MGNIMSEPRNKKELLHVGLAMLESGCSVIPIDKSTKKPLRNVLPYLYDEQGQRVMKSRVDQETGEVSEFHARGWKPFQTVRATAQELTQWVNRDAQLAVVCGAVSGGMLIIDFDMFNDKTENLYEQWVSACKDKDLDVRLLPTQRTGSGGFQVAVRCQNPGENTKLAWVEDITEARGRKVAIETRGALPCPALPRLPYRAAPRLALSLAFCYNTPY